MKYVLITGAGNGLGYQTTKALVERGYYVFACDMNIDKLVEDNNPNIKPMLLDVTDYNAILKAYHVVKRVTPELDAIINYAGISRFGSLIETNIDVMEKVVNVNLFGTIRINKVFFYMMKPKTGRIINISSENGWQTPSPFNGIYSMSKFALEAYNDSLRRELNFLGLKVIKIQPGSFKSNMHNDVRQQFKDFLASTKLYPKIVRKMGKMMNKELNSANDIKYLLNAIYHALESNKPKLNYRVKNSSSLTFLSRVPAKTADNMLLKNLQ